MRKAILTVALLFGVVAGAGLYTALQTQVQREDRAKARLEAARERLAKAEEAYHALRNVREAQGPASLLPKWAQSAELKKLREREEALKARQKADRSKAEKALHEAAIELKALETELGIARK